MINSLKIHFPMIKTRDEIRNYIRTKSNLETMFQSWKKERQDEFLDFTCGARGVKILYDSFFKEVMNPEYYPERLNDLLSVILGIKVEIVQVLPTDSTRLGMETSLVVMDIVVMTEDGTLINVEVQKIGYRFPGERSACYSADLLLRQYRRLRDSCKNDAEFSYKNVKPVYTIVFFEKSPELFKEYPEEYVHRFEQTSDTGIEISLLQKYIFIPLDIYKKMGKNIDTKLEAWLTFLGSDDVEDILHLIELYPEFKPMYETLYEMCLNIEGVMNMFSKELYELDRNEEKLMIDEMKQEADALKQEADALKQEIDALRETNKDLKETNKDLKETNKDLKETNKDLKETNEELREEMAILKEELKKLKSIQS